MRKVNGLKVGVALTVVVLAGCVLTQCGKSGKVVYEEPIKTSILSLKDSSVIDDVLKETTFYDFSSFGYEKESLLDGLDTLENSLDILDLTEDLRFDTVDMDRTGLDEVLYTVKAGDSLTAISAATGLSIDRIKEINKLESDLIIEGDTLKVTPEFPKYDSEDVKEMISMYQDIETSTEEKERILSVLKRTRYDADNWIKSNALTVLEKSAMLVVKAGCVDGLELEKDDVYNARIARERDRGDGGDEVYITSGDKYYGVNVQGYTGSLIDIIYNIQRGNSFDRKDMRATLDQIEAASLEGHKATFFKQIIKPTK